MATIFNNSVYNIPVNIRNFQSFIDCSKIPIEYLESSRDYVKKWCEEWTFREGRFLLMIKTRKNQLEFEVSDVLDEVANP